MLPFHVGFNIGDVSIGYTDGYYDNVAIIGTAGPITAIWRPTASAHADNYHDWRHDDKHHHD